MATKGMFERAVNSRQEIPLIFEYNTAIIHLAKSEETGRLRHVDVSYHYTKWLIQLKKVEIKCYCQFPTL